MAVIEHYKSLLARSADALERLAADHETFVEFTKAHNFLADYEKLHGAIAGRPEAKVLELANREYQFALYAASTAMYRHATHSLRLFLELALATVQFSAYEIKLRQWLIQAADINWDGLSNMDSGVFSKSFIGAFSDGLEDNGRQYAAIATKTYRECSEFVHGNIKTHGDAAAPLGYDKDMMTAWTERAESVRLCILFAFASRYLDHISQDAQGSLESMMLENLGQLQGVQASFAKQVNHG